jgi:hypothetical protein
MTHGLPPSVRRFLARDVDSVEALEVLLLLRAHAGRAWDVDAIVAELRSTPFSIRRRLEALAKRRVVRFEDGCWCYAAEPKVDAVIAEVAESYDRLRLRVIEALYGAPKPEPLRAFADAFRLREAETVEDEDEDDRDG